MEAIAPLQENFLVADYSKLLQLDMILRILLQILLFIASAFFSGSETALFSLSRFDLQQLRREQHPNFYKLQSLLEQPRQLIISILCGNEIINIAATINMTAILVALYGDARAGLLSLLFMVPLLLLFGEVTPKTIAVSDPVKVSTRLIATPLHLWVILVTPFRWAIRLISDRLTTRIVGQETAAENILKIDEFRTLIDEIERGGELTTREHTLIVNLLEAGTTEVVEIMIPRTEVAFIDADLSMPEIVEMVKTFKFTRLPVFRDSRDNLVGFIHAEDILQYILIDKDFGSMKLEDILHPIIIVPPTKKIDELLDFFLKHKGQAAAVLNEFGGIDGLVTLKSVFNFVFGNITPETTRHPRFRECEDNVFEVDGDMKLTDFNNLTHFELNDPRMTTIGGIMLRTLDRLPRVNDEINIDGVELKVLEMLGNRISLLRASKGQASNDNYDTPIS